MGGAGQDHSQLTPNISYDDEVTYAPQSLLTWRRVFTSRFPHIPATDFGIVGGPSHILTGTSYHLGRDQLKLSRDPYSVRTARDKAGLSDAASAGDVTDEIGPPLLRELSQWVVAQARLGASDAADLREVIFSPDGRAVLTWDRERGRTSYPMPRGDLSHRTHTHFSWYRDSEFHDRAALFERFFTETSVTQTKGESDMFFLRSASVPQVYVSNGINSRVMPGGTWESTIAPLVNAGVPIIDYPDLDSLLKAGGPPASASTTGSEPVTDEQLERVLRKVFGSLG